MSAAATSFMRLTVPGDLRPCWPSRRSARTAAGMNARVKIACVQTNAGPEVGPNLAAAEALIRKAAGEGAQFVMTPENTSIIEPNRAKNYEKSFAEDSHPGLPRFSALARSLKIWLLVGSMPIRVDGERLANRSFLIDDHGRITARYDKIHLFD